MEMSANPIETTVKPRIATQKIVLGLGIASIIMLFAGLTSGYIVRQAEGRWAHFEIPVVFYVSTAIILLSSVTHHLAVLAVKKNKLQETKNMLILTLGLGLAFVFTQFMGWNELVKNGVHFVDRTTPSGSFFFVITGLHLAHIFFGILGLIITSAKSIRERYSADNYLGISLSAIYWHFLDGLWIYLFVFLAVYR
jgi:cytochrome c oxidase subunit 3